MLGLVFAAACSNGSSNGHDAARSDPEVALPGDSTLPDVPGFDAASFADESAVEATSPVDHFTGDANHETTHNDVARGAARRIPGEWEEQAAVWMQWPTQWEATLRPDFARLIAVVQKYEEVHLLVLNAALGENARSEITKQGGNADDVTYHHLAYDSSWLRDNGPVYLATESGTVVQDWGFDAWGGNFGAEIPYAADDVVPTALADILQLPCEDHGDYVLERGNLESNGGDTVILGWDCQLHRNPGWSQEETEALFQEALGVQRVIWVHGHDPEDLTTGHIDGAVRFVDEDTVAVARSLIMGDLMAPLLDDAADTLSHAGFEVVRIDSPGTVKYRGYDLPALYMNWLVGNGFVAAMAFGNQAWDDAALDALENLYPSRDVHMLSANELWFNGGGLHCITNDQPQLGM